MMEKRCGASVLSSVQPGAIMLTITEYETGSIARLVLDDTRDVASFIQQILSTAEQAWPGLVTGRVKVSELQQN